MAKNLSQFSIHICGSLLYTIRPIQEAINLFNENQFARVEADLTKQRVAKKLAKFGHVSPHEPLCEVLPEEASPSPIEDDTGEIEPLPENLRGTKKKQDKGLASPAPPARSQLPAMRAVTGVFQLAVNGVKIREETA